MFASIGRFLVGFFTRGGVEGVLGRVNKLHDTVDLVRGEVEKLHTTKVHSASQLLAEANELALVYEDLKGSMGTPTETSLPQLPVVSQ